MTLRNSSDPFGDGIPTFDEGAVATPTNLPTIPTPVLAESTLPNFDAKPATTPNDSTVLTELNPISAASTNLHRSQGGFWRAMPSWLVSMIIHVGAILTLAAIHIEPINKELKLLLNASEVIAETESMDVAEEISQEIADSLAPEPSESVAASPAPTIESNFTEGSAMEVLEIDVGVSPMVSVPSVTTSLAPLSGLEARANTTMRSAMTGRQSKEARRDLLRKFGGSDATEKSVSMALKWLADHQNKQTGAWTLAHGPDNPGERAESYNAATGLALMCFLGAGQTHLEGEYKETVFRGLSFLIKNMRARDGYLGWYVGGRGADDMYSHGIATIAVCEAYGMTKDLALAEAAQAGINFLTYAQNPQTGGWHYGPKGKGDTSVVGWQLMAIKSAAMSGLGVDLNVVRKANYFLDQMSHENGTAYHYDFNSVARNAGYNPSCTACALLCRIYSGMPKDNPSLQAIVEKFDKAGPHPSATYYNYYATQVMKQYGGKEWERWNERMRDKLVSTQVQSGKSAGSWYWEDGHSTKVAGRFYTTCMATMILEVYYRYLPIYGEQKEEDTFKL